MSGKHLSDITGLVGSRLYILLAGSALMVLLARWLTPEAFGQFQLILSMVWIFPILVDWGISHSLPRYIAEFRSRDIAMVRPALRAGLRLKLVAMIVGTILLVMMREPLTGWFKLDSVSHVLPLGLLLLLGFSLSELFLKLSEGFQRFEGIPVVTFIKNTGDLILSLGLVALGFGLTGALFGKLIATWIAGALGLIWLIRTALRSYPGPRSSPAGLSRKIMSYGTWLILIDVAERIFIYGDRLLINRFLGPEMVGLYSVPARIMLFSQLIGLSVASVIGPAVGRDLEESRPALRSSLRFLLALYALMAVLILGLGDWIILFIFGPEYSGSVPSLRVIALTLPLIGISPVLSLVLNYRGAAKQRVAFIVLAMVITISGNLILIPRMGILGSAISMGAGQLVYVVTQGLFCARTVPLVRFWSPLLIRILTISLGSLGVIWMIRRFIPGDLSPVIAGLIATLGYVVALIRSGVTSRDELRSLIPRARGSQD